MTNFYNGQLVFVDEKQHFFLSVWLIAVFLSVRLSAGRSEDSEDFYLFTC